MRVICHCGTPHGPEMSDDTGTHPAFSLADKEPCPKCTPDKCDGTLGGCRVDKLPCCDCYEHVKALREGIIAAEAERCAPDHKMLIESCFNWTVRAEKAEAERDAALAKARMHFEANVRLSTIIADLEKERNAAVKALLELA